MLSRRKCLTFRYNSSDFESEVQDTIGNYSIILQELQMYILTRSYWQNKAYDTLHRLTNISEIVNILGTTTVIITYYYYFFPFLKTTC